MSEKFPNGQNSVNGVSARFLNDHTGHEYFITAPTLSALIDVVDEILGVELNAAKAGTTVTTRAN